MEYIDSMEQDVALFYEGEDIEWTYLVDGDHIYTVAEMRSLVEQYVSLVARLGISSPVFSLGFEPSRDSAYSWVGFLRMVPFRDGENMCTFPHFLMLEEDALYLARSMRLPTPLECTEWWV